MFTTQQKTLQRDVDYTSLKCLIALTREKKSTIATVSATK